MKKIQLSSLHSLCLAACAAFSGASWAASTGLATFDAAGRTYSGIYSTAEKLISVNIDGLTYKGYYASSADDNAGVSSGVTSGKWGRAFLFASSAQILNCQLDTELQKISGRCQGTDGRHFKLTFGAPD